MKKRIISFVLVAVMLLTLMPFGAFAALGDIAVVKQPLSQTVFAGDFARFEFEAKRTGSLTGGSINYLWFDDDEFDLDGLELLLKITTVMDKALGTEKTLIMENVTTDMDGMKIRCAAWYLDGLSKRGIVLSEPVTLHVKVREACTVHDLVYHAAKAPTCVKDGSIEYWQCDVCHRIYTDEIGFTEITLKDTVLASDPSAHSMEHHERVEPTCKKDGSIEYWQCEHCGNRYANEIGAGNTLKLSDIEIDNSEAKHVLTKVEAKEATCDVPGNKEYYVCDVCGDYFNAVGTLKYTKSEVTLSTLPHTPAYDHDSNTHWQYCTECGSLIAGTTANHNDKEHKATCTTKAICECGYEHGDVDPENHENTELRGFKEATTEGPGYTGDLWCLDCGRLLEEGHVSDKLCAHNLKHFEAKEAKCEECEDGGNGNIEYWYCDKCGCYYTDAEAQTEVSAEAVVLKAQPHHVKLVGQTVANTAVQERAWDNVSHWMQCKYCGYEFPGTINNHNFAPDILSKPTCCSGKSCLTCGYDNGERDMTNHVGGTELVGACEPEGKNPGYTGDTVCKGCGEIIQKGWEYKNKCSDGKCADHLKHIDAEPSDCHNDGTKEHWQCRKCGNIYMDADATVDGNPNTIIDKCTGHEIHPGTDVLSSVNITEILSKMGWTRNDLLAIIESGDLSSLKNISIDDFLDQVQVKDIDHCSDDEYHWLGCQKCGKSLVDLRSDLEKQGIFINEKWYQLSAKTAHSGGHATCSSKAICDECGSEYGKVGTHEYLPVVTPATCTEPGCVKYICNGCGGEDESKATTTPALGHNFVMGSCTRLDANGHKCTARITNPFKDVSHKQWYYTAVMWAYTYNPQITNGTSENTFSPMSVCTRSQVVTFLWRAAGKPTPTTSVNPFNDVKPGTFYYDAVLWAVEKGITNGVGAGRFNPDGVVTRGEFVTFLWRYKNYPEPTVNYNPFTDVYSDGGFGFAYKPILWAYGAGITNGTTATTFSPTKTCTRAEVVTFMQRAIGT